MLSSPTIIAIGFGYLLLLFLVAYWGDRQSHAKKTLPRPWVYSLTLAVFCTSWAFYGVVGQTVSYHWLLVPTFVGPVLLFWFGRRFLERLVQLGQDQHTTSIADFIASRLSQSRALARAITVVCILGIIPYIALQLKAVSVSYAVITDSSSSGQGWFGDPAVYVALVLAAFSILFGTRHLDSREHHNGLMLAMAFESVVKLLALTALCLFMLYHVFDGPGQFLHMAMNNADVQVFLADMRATDVFLAQLLIGLIAILCLPRQFHALVVEYRGKTELERARQVFPAYLLWVNLMIVPIAIGGIMLFPSGNSDLFVLTTPINQHNHAMTLIAFIGGLSAATSMVVMATVALATMVTNDVVMPTLIRRGNWNHSQSDQFNRRVLLVRRVVIGIITLGAYLYYRWFAEVASLATIGVVAFAAIAQLAPALLAAIYRPNVAPGVVLSAMLMGLLVWAWCMLVPNVVSAGYLPPSLLSVGPLEQSWLRPQALFGIAGLHPTAHGTLLSLGVNVLVLFVGYQLSQRRWRSTHIRNRDSELDEISGGVSDAQLQQLAERFVGAERVAKAFADLSGKPHRLHSDRPASVAAIALTRRLLSGAIGQAAARVVLSAALRKSEQVKLDDLVSLVDETAMVYQFNHQLLSATLEHLSEGVSVIDRNLRLVAWNSAYLRLFQYPEGFIYAGKPVADVIQFNAERGLCGPGSVAQHVDKRLNHLLAATPHVFEREQVNGQVIEMRGNPMPGGGFVTSFIDITERKQIERALQEANESLELRVADRTRALSDTNQELSRAKQQAEAANATKSRFLAAVSHDLMQPLNAASLFVSALEQRVPDQERQLTGQVSKSLAAAEEMLASLVDISKLERGQFALQRRDFNLKDALTTLTDSMRPLAAEKDLAFRVRLHSVMVTSDSTLLQRILQNFLTNALRYTEQGGILLSSRRRGDHLELQVYDTGIGIPEDQLATVFQEFQRLPGAKRKSHEGLGLGLSIAKGFANLLGHRIEVRSVPGQGSMFSLRVPLGKQAVSGAVKPLPLSQEQRPFVGLNVLFLDNDPQIRAGMEVLLTQWGCRVASATDLHQAKALLESDVDTTGADAWAPDVLILDYHLEDGVLGTDFLAYAPDLPAIVITADRSKAVERRVQEQGAALLYKPVKPQALAAWLRTSLAGASRQPAQMAPPL